MVWQSKNPNVSTDIDVSAGVAKIPLFHRDSSHVWVTIDLADLPLVEAYSWYEAKGSGVSSYAHASVGRRGIDRRTVLMHRILVDASPGMHVDHEDGDGLNNRRSNIRIATPSQNRANEVNRRRSTSPYKGTHWLENDQVWRAYLGVDRRVRFLGNFDDAISAALAYDDAARLEYGEFARTNFTVEEAAEMPRSPRRRRISGRHGARRYKTHKCRCEICFTAYRAIQDRANAQARAKRRAA